MTIEPDISKLNERNIKSTLRSVGGDYLDDQLKDKRWLHDLIAGEAQWLANQYIATEITATTSLHNERIILTVPHDRNPVWEQSFMLKLREDLSGANAYNGGRRHFKNCFRDIMLSYIRQVAQTIIEYTDRRQKISTSVPTN